MKAIAYYRVSSEEQKKKQSIGTQKVERQRFFDEHNIDLVAEFQDDGISGEEVSTRPGFQECLNCIATGQADILWVYLVDRIGRFKARRDRNHVIETLEDGKTSVMDSDGDLWRWDNEKEMNNLEFELNEARQDNVKRIKRVKAGLLAKAKRKESIGGKYPPARTWDKENTKWVPIKNEVKLIQWAAQEYLAGRSLKKIVKELKPKGYKVSYDTLLNILKNKCNDKWIKVVNGEEIVYSVPRILEDNVIEKIRKKVDFNRTNTKAHFRKYALRGFIRCGECGFALSGLIEGGKYSYYRHRLDIDCPMFKKAKFRGIPAPAVEEQVLKTIFKHTKDQPGYMEQVKNALPDSKQVKVIEQRLKDNQKVLSQLDKKVDLLIDDYTEGLFPKEKVKAKMEEYNADKEELEQRVKRDEGQLATLPNSKFIERRADQIREDLAKYFQSEDRIKTMTYEEKRRLFDWLFPNELDEHGKQYGVYVRKLSNNVYDFEVNATILTEGKFIVKDDGHYEDKDTLYPVLKPIGNSKEFQYSK